MEDPVCATSKHIMYEDIEFNLILSCDIVFLH